MPYPNQPSDEPIPAHLNRWNWGAFLLHWIWGIGNNTFIAFLMFIPFVNVVMAFVLGAKGSKWAWKNKQWANEEHFKRVQRNWAKAAVVAYLAVIALFIVIFFGVAALLKDSDLYRLTTKTLEADEQVISLLGEPLEYPDLAPSGQVKVNGNAGSGNFNFSVSGPKGKAIVFSQGEKMGVWKLTHLSIVEEGSTEPIILIE